MADGSVFVRAIYDPASSRQEKFVHEAWIHEVEEQHDIAVLDITRDTDVGVEFQTGVPIQILYGRKPKSFGNFFGYVWYTEPQYTFKVSPAHRMTRVVCLSASKVMADPITHSYTNQTSTSVARQIVTPYRFSTDFVESTFVWGAINTAGDTVWQVLQNLADREGWTYWCHNTDLKFFPRLTLLERPSTPLLTFVTRDKAVPETLFEFRPISGDDSSLPGATKATRHSFGIDPRQGGMVIAQSQTPTTRFGMGALSPAPLFGQLLTNQVAETPGQATQRVQAQDEKNKFYIRASVTLNGDSRITQGMPVLLDGLGRKHSGYWYMHKAVHHLEKGRYTIDGEVGRDGAYDQGLRLSPQRGSTLNRVDPYGTVVSKQPATILANNTWVSAWIPQPGVSR